MANLRVKGILVAVLVSVSVISRSKLVFAFIEHKIQISYRGEGSKLKGVRCDPVSHPNFNKIIILLATFKQCFFQKFMNPICLLVAFHKSH
jgi:hypothetical protein